MTPQRIEQIRRALLADDDDEGYVGDVNEICNLALEALKARSSPDPIGEALNSGTGVYKP